VPIPKAMRLTPVQQDAWPNYVRPYRWSKFEMNRQLQAGSGLSLADYVGMHALSGELADGFN
jgi:hypothetical protein